MSCILLIDIYEMTFLINNLKLLDYQIFVICGQVKRLNDVYMHGNVCLGAGTN